MDFSWRSDGGRVASTASPVFETGAILIMRRLQGAWDYMISPYIRHAAMWVTMAPDDARAAQELGDLVRRRGR